MSTVDCRLPITLSCQITSECCRSFQTDFLLPTQMKNADTNDTPPSWILLGSFIVLLVLFQVAIARLSLQREAKRRWQHALTGQSFVVLSYYMNVPLIGVPALLLSAACIWYLRYYQTDVYLLAFGPLLRPNEREGIEKLSSSSAAAVASTTSSLSSSGSVHTRTTTTKSAALPGAFYFLLGTAITVWLFPLPMARYAILCLSWADPVAAWAGQATPAAWRIPIHSSATVSGCLACFCTAMVIGYVCLARNSSTEGSGRGDNNNNWSSIVAGAFACTCAEALPVGNDNLLIPIVTAAFTQMA